MPNANGRAGLLIRSIYAACLLVATGTHVVPLIQHGLSWDYGVGRFSATFWTFLAVADPLATVCLFAWPRLGLVMTIAIIVSDVLHNAIVFSDVLLRPSMSHLWTLAAFALQVAFLVFVGCTVRTAWRQTKSGPPPPTGEEKDVVGEGA